MVPPAASGRFQTLRRGGLHSFITVNEETALQAFEQLLQALDRAAGVLGDYFYVRSCQSLQRFAEFLEATVSHGDRDVAEEASVAGAAYRCFTKNLTKLCLGERSHLLEWRLGVYRLKCGLGSYGGAPVPGTHVLADVTTKDMP